MFSSFNALDMIFLPFQLGAWALTFARRPLRAFEYLGVALFVDPEDIGYCADEMPVIIEDVNSSRRAAVSGRGPSLSAPFHSSLYSEGAFFSS